MKIFIFILLIILMFSCDKKNIELKVYQYHKKELKDFSFLSKYKNLEAIDLSGTNVKNLSFLKDLKKLKVLLLINTKINDLSYIKNLTNLEELYLSRTNISDISDLKNLKNLKILQIENTKVINIKTLKQLNLKQLSLDNLFADEYGNTYYEYSKIFDIIDYYSTCKELEEFKGEQIYKDHCKKECKNPIFLSINKNNLIKYPDLLISLYYKYENTKVDDLNLWGLSSNYKET